MIRRRKPVILLFIQNIKINNQISAPELRVLDESGENLGVMTKEAALALAKEKGLDLVGVSPLAKPPVAKIISFDKFRYQQEKKDKQQKSQQKKTDLKQIQISIREASHDMERKSERIKEFFDDGHRVEIFLVLRGREKYNRDWAKRKMEEFLKMLPEHKMTTEPKFGMRGLIAQISKI
ncbi:MAG: translation initiation factor IF-3 [bacterium]|nr:translation initiation factor IF-3 [bacterium]